jgi:iron(III) transport system substrate-binding protein
VRSTHYYWFRLRQELGEGEVHSALYFLPNRNVGSLENISGAAMLVTSNARDEQAPQEAGVRLLPRARPLRRSWPNRYDYETRPLRGARPNPQLPAVATIAPAILNPNTLGNDQQAAQPIQGSGLA